MTFGQVLSRLQNVKVCGEGRTARCPSHEDRENSLKADERDGRILFHCHAGCSVESICGAIGITVADLFLNSRNGHATNGNGTSNPPLTLEAFGKRKGFTTEFLTLHGVAEERGVLKFPYGLMNGQKAPRQRLRTATGFLWSKGEGHPKPYGLQYIVDARKRGVQDLFLEEGESDWLTLKLHGFTGLGIPGAANTALLQKPEIRSFAHIFILKENDEGGATFERGCVARLAHLEYRAQVHIVEMARANVKDVNDLHVKFLNEPGAFASEFGALVEMARIAPVVELPIVGLEAFDASMVQERKVEWLWSNRIPRAKLTLLVGAPGLGKSFSALEIAARVSDRGLWPDGAFNGTIGRTIVFSAEDDLEDTIVARLIAQKADLTNVTVCRRIREMNESGEMTRRGFNLARDLPHLERLLDTCPDTRLVIIDPVSAYAGRTDTHKNAEMRTEVLDPLSEMASRRSVAVIAITHWNKGSGGSLERVSGSIAFPAAARQVWGFVADPDDAMRTLMLFGKSNVGPRVAGLAFRISEIDGRATLTWEAGDVDQKLDDVLRQERGDAKDEMGKLEQACDSNPRDVRRG